MKEGNKELVHGFILLLFIGVLSAIGVHSVYFLSPILYLPIITSCIISLIIVMDLSIKFIDHMMTSRENSKTSDVKAYLRAIYLDKINNDFKILDYRVLLPNKEANNMGGKWKKINEEVADILEENDLADTLITTSAITLPNNAEIRFVNACKFDVVVVDENDNSELSEAFERVDAGDPEITKDGRAAMTFYTLHKYSNDFGGNEEKHSDPVLQNIFGE